MSDNLIDDDDSGENLSRVSRPTLAQVKAVIHFMEKHPNLAHRRLRIGMGHTKFRNLWVELADIVNKMDGAIKSTKGWIKFWSDKRRSIIIKKKQIEQGTLKGSLTALEEKILDVCNDDSTIHIRRKKNVKEEQCNGDDDDSFDDELSIDSQVDNSRPDSPEIDEEQLKMIDKMVSVMNQQSVALSQLAQASLTSAKALEKIAEASHIQAMAVDRIAGSFERISSSIHDVRNAIIGIDYTMKRCFPATATQQRQNSNMFN